MEGCKCQLSVKILCISQFSAKFQANCQLSVKWLLIILKKTLNGANLSQLAPFIDNIHIIKCKTLVFVFRFFRYGSDRSQPISLFSFLMAMIGHGRFCFSLQQLFLKLYCIFLIVCVFFFKFNSPQILIPLEITFIVKIIWFIVSWFLGFFLA